MHSGPSKTAEAIVSIVVPPASREEVMGDLHERFKSPLQYTADAVRTVPLVILSRIRRTADPQILLIQAFVQYVSFLGAAWLKDRPFLSAQWGSLLLAIPAMMAVLGLTLDDAYANPKPRAALNLARGPLLGVVLALGSQEILRISSPELTIPRWVAFYGCAASLLLSSAVRMLFPPIANQFLGANAPALWLKQAEGSSSSPQVMIRVLKGISALVAVAVVGTWITEFPIPPRAVLVTLLLVLLVAFQVSKRD